MAYHKENFNSPNYGYSVVISEPAAYGNGRVEYRVIVKRQLKGSRRIQKTVKIAGSTSEALDMVRNLKKTVCVPGHGYTLRSA